MPGLKRDLEGAMLRLPKVEGHGGDVSVGRDLNNLLNLMGVPPFLRLVVLFGAAPLLAQVLLLGKPGAHLQLGDGGGPPGANAF